MRAILILLCLAALAAIGWQATVRGLDAPFLGGASRIELEAADQARAALAAAPDVRVTALGRDVVLGGEAASAAARDRILAAAGEAPLVRRVVDRIVLLPPADPFRLVAVRSPGAVALSGNVPGASAGEALLAGVRALWPSGLRADLQPASGAPPGWSAMAEAGLRALAPLGEGRLEIEGASVRLTGVAPDAAAREAALAAADGAPGSWQIDIGQVDALGFTAAKAPDGAVTVGGTVPDAATRDALLGAAGALGAQPVGGTVDLAGGVAPSGWRELVGRGIEALARTVDGRLTVAGTGASLSGTVAGEEERAAIAALLGPGWDIDLSLARAGPPPAEITVEVNADGRVAAAGMLPADMPPETFAALLPGVDAGALGQGDAAGSEGWQRAVEGMSIVLPRLRNASVRLREGRLAITGALRSGYSAEGTRATLVAALPRDWEVAVDLAESEPIAELLVDKGPDSLVLSGLLPAGLRPEEAVALSGGGAIGDGLAGGGAGDARHWSRTVAALGGLIGLFDRARAQIAEGELEMTGVLRPGYPAEAVARRLSAGMPPGWRASLEAAETPPGEGDRRVGLETGETEVYRSGFWLPELDFPVSLERCAAEANRALARGEVPFVNNSAEIDAAGHPLVDRLAAIAIRCLNSSAMKLEIAGHTDSVGNDAENQALSELRARALRDALLARGVRAQALTATGYGESRPVDSNDTAQGRSRNSRIAFNWSEG